MSTEDADLAAARFRIPNPLYWAPLLQTMGRHAGDIAKEGVFEAATVCELWLRNMPIGFAGRREAAQVAIAPAREVQGRRAEGVIFVENVDRIIYEALLQACPEYPDEVSQIALELCGRRNEGEEIVRRAIEAEEVRWRGHRKRQEQETGKPKQRPNIPIPLPSSWGPVRFARLDGPRRKVPDSFRSAVLDTIALVG